MRKRATIYVLAGAAALLAAVLIGFLVGRQSHPRENPEASTHNQVTEAHAANDSQQIMSLPPAEQTARAFEAAFGAKRSVTIRSGENREPTKFTPGKLIWAPYGPVLLSEGSVVDPSHVSAGQLAVVYLKPNGSGFEVQNRFVPAIESGSVGNLAEWSVSSKISGFPVVYVEGGGTWQGYTCSTATLLELTPAKPIELVSIPVYYGDEGAITDDTKATEIEGKITNVIKDRSFDVVYSGSKRFTNHYVRRGSRYVLQSGHSAMEEC